MKINQKLLPKVLRPFLFGKEYGISARQMHLVNYKNGKKIRGLSVIIYGRFGNNLLQISNALMLAQVLGLKFVQLPPLFWLDIKEPIEVDDIVLIPHDYQSEKVGPLLRSSFFYEPRFEKLNCGHSTRRLVLQKYVKPLLTLPGSTDEEELTIHIRSGDVFSENPHPTYAQPPLAFYRRMLRHEAERTEALTVRVVYEDRANPCVSALEAFVQSLGIPLTMQSGSFAKDIGTLLSAKKLAFGYGTLGIGVCLLSEEVTSVDAFGDCGFAIQKIEQIQSVRVWRDVLGDYISQGAWQNTESQRDLMVSYPDDAVDLTIGPSETLSRESPWWITRA